MSPHENPNTKPYLTLFGPNCSLRKLVLIVYCASTGIFATCGLAGTTPPDGSAPNPELR